MYEDLPKSRKEAILISSKYYIKDEPCLRGHISPRRTKNSYCVECDLLKSKEHRKKIMKAVKQFTIREDKNCKGQLVKGNKCCALGAFLKVCEVPVEELDKHGFPSLSRVNQLGVLYNTDYLKLDDLLWKITRANDKKKISWVQRIKNIRELFKQIGVKVNFVRKV